MNLDPRLFRLARQEAKPLTVTILLGFGAGALTVWQAWVLSIVVGGAFLRRQSLAELADPLALLLALMLLRALLAWGSESAAASLASRIKTALRQQLAAHLFALGPIGGGQERTGELSMAVTQGVEALDAYFSQYLPQLALAALVPLTFLLFVFPIDPLTGLVLLLTAPLLPLFMILVGSQAQAATRRQWRILSRLNAYFLDVIQGLATLKMFGRSRMQAALIESASERYRHATMSVLRVAFLSALALEMVATLSTAVVAVEVGLRLLYEHISFEQAFLVLLLAPEFYLPLRLLGTRFHAGMSGMAAAGQIFSILEQPPVCAPEPDQPGQTAAGQRQPPAIRFQDVHLTYPDGRRALHGVSFELAPGKITALVGPSGAGKSSLASLLLRFIEPQSGEIWVDGRPLRSFSPEAWRAQLAWVPQSPYLFNDTLAANVRLSAPATTPTGAQPDSAVVAACQLAGMEAFIQELPSGYDTPLGERGRRLSGGQAQRIALARAFLQDAPLLILDEPAASLDPASEAWFNDALPRLATGRTVMLIAHRLSTVRRADHIVVLEAGQVVEQGSHDDLARAGGLYSRLLQACSAIAGREDSADERLHDDDTGQSRIKFRHEDNLVSRQGDSGFPQSGETPLPIESAPSGTSPPALPPIKEQSGARTVHSASHAKQDRPPRPFFLLLSQAAAIKGWISLSVLSGMATIASSVGLMSASAYIISAAALHPSIADLQVAIVGVRFFGLVRGVFRYLERLVSHQAAFRLLARLRVWFYTHLEPLAPARLLRFRSGDLLTRMIEDIESLENFYVRALAPPLVALGVALGMTAFFWSFDSRLALTLLGFHALAGCGVPLLAFLANRYPERSSALPLGRRLVAMRAALNAFLVDLVQGMPDLLAANRQEQWLTHLTRLDGELSRIQRRMARLSALQNALVILLANLGLWAVLVQAIPHLPSGHIEGVYLATLALAALASFEAFSPLPQAAQRLETDLQAAGRLAEIINAAPEVCDPPRSLTVLHPDKQGAPAPQPLPSAPPVGDGQAVAFQPPLHRDTASTLLDVRDLRFAYPPAVELSDTLLPTKSSGAHHPQASVVPVLALDGLTFRLDIGQALAIVGANGAGKSTLAGLLLRFWEYQEGRILLFGADLRHYSQEEARRLISVVPQHPYLFHATVRDNLLIARPSASEEEIIRAAQAAQIDEFIRALPQGYETWIGEQGLRLSGGERQRIAIARALLKNAPLLILDEATANLDALTERQLLQALREIGRDHAIIHLTHRLAGLESMDEIIVLHQGRIIERGRHTDLLAADGWYSSMLRLQRQELSNLYAWL